MRGCLRDSAAPPQRIQGLGPNRKSSDRNADHLIWQRTPIDIELGYSVAPMIDLGFFRAHLDDIETMARNRGVSLDLGRFREIDSERRALITAVERLKAERNTASLEIAGLKKSGGDASSLLSR